ncbi:MAG: hypothetical protein KJN90_04775 [Gammaproteobacteria bacterium]|nr:hypothetical protein [Gammaproteobacteria bacterium]
MSYRPSNPKPITISDLRPGDILGSCGTSTIDKIVTLVDQGDYSHISQCVDVVDGQQYVVESTMKGIKYDAVDAVDTKVQDLVDCYRYTSKDGHHLGDEGWPVQPLVDVAKSYPGGKYCWDLTLTMGLVILGSRVPEKNILKTIIRIGGGIIVAEIEKLIEKKEHVDKTPMTCVQVATSAYWQAKTTPEHKYGLLIDIDDKRHPSKANPVNLLESGIKDLEAKAYLELRKEIEKLYRRHFGDEFVESILARLDAAPGPLIAGSALLPLGTCSPTDIQTSPSLEFVGCLKDTRKHGKH